MIYLDAVSTPTHIVRRGEHNPITDEEFVAIDDLFGSLCMLKMNGVPIENVIDIQDRYHDAYKEGIYV